MAHQGGNHPYSIYYCGYMNQKMAKYCLTESLSHYDHRTFHRLIGVVGQEPNLFGDIAKNITYGFKRKNPQWTKLSMQQNWPTRMISS